MYKLSGRGGRRYPPKHEQVNGGRTLLIIDSRSLRVISRSLFIFLFLSLLLLFELPSLTTRYHPHPHSGFKIILRRGLLTNNGIHMLTRAHLSNNNQREEEEEEENSSATQVLCGVTPNKKKKKKAALKGLEDVYLQPPNRAAFQKRSRKSLPDLLKEEYPRRVFIADDSRALDWFYTNYPLRDQEFEVYDGDGWVVSDLMSKINLRGADYVVMKAEAQVVEQMMRDQTMCLVDQLFMECRNEWEDNGQAETSGTRSYWQCLDLYRRVRDEGIAVHKWWGY